MTLYGRKLAEQAMEDSRSTPDPMLSLNWYEDRFLMQAETSDEDPAKAVGGMMVIIADLMEKVRRTDPAYGLTPIGGDDSE